MTNNTCTETPAQGGDACFKVVSLIRLDVPPIDTLLTSEYDEWGLCNSCGVQTHKVFVRRREDGGAIDNSRVKLPVTIPGKVQVGKCLNCKKRNKGKDSNGNDDDDAVSEKSLFPDLLEAPAMKRVDARALVTPHLMVRSESHISDGDTSTTSSEPSQLSWSESEVSEDSILRRVVSFAHINDTATSTEDSASDGRRNSTTIASSVKYKKRTGEDDSIGTSIATSLASNSDSENDSSGDDSDDDTVVSGNRSPQVKTKKEIDPPSMQILKLDQPFPSRRTQSSPGKLAREWRRFDVDNDALLRSSTTSSSPLNHMGFRSSSPISNSRPKWTARSAIMTHEEELQAMLTRGMSTEIDNTGISGDQDSVDSTSGDLACMAARLRKTYGVSNLSFPSTASIGSSGKSSSLLSGKTTSTTESISEHSSSGWIAQSREGDKKTWNRKILGYFSADKILGRHRSGSKQGRR